jgi:hypothetical protein
MKIDLICGCKPDRSEYMKEVGFGKSGDIGTIKYRCANCGCVIILEVDVH